MIDLSIFNPWWQDGNISAALRGKSRQILDEIRRYIEPRQILIFSGLRRAGKTTLMFQIIDDLLKLRGTNPYHILYFSFDETKAEIQEIFSEYERNVLKEQISKVDRIFLFFDEIQKLQGWPEKIKVIYDLHPNVKIFLSGSAAINIKKSSRESLAGRFFEFPVEPLDFDEYLEFKGIEVDKERENIFEVQIRRSFDDFVRTGGFVEALGFDEAQRRKYFKEGLLERVIFRDLPEAFTVTSAELLYRLLTISAERPGMYLDYKNVGNDLGFDQRTIANYYSYLEYALLVTKLFNYSPNHLTSEKKMKKLYLSNTAFTVALAGRIEPSNLIEQFFVNLFKTRYFFRTPQKDEVDIVINIEDRVIPVEVKIQSEIKKKEAKPVFKFLKRYKQPKGLIISSNQERSFIDGDYAVDVMPYWKYWSVKRKISPQESLL